MLSAQALKRLVWVNVISTDIVLHISMTICLTVIQLQTFFKANNACSPLPVAKVWSSPAPNVTVQSVSLVTNAVNIVQPESRDVCSVVRLEERRQKNVI